MWSFFSRYSEYLAIAIQDIKKKIEAGEEFGESNDLIEAIVRNNLKEKKEG